MLIKNGVGDVFTNPVLVFIAVWSVRKPATYINGSPANHNCMTLTILSLCNNACHPTITGSEGLKLSPASPSLTICGLRTESEIQASALNAFTINIQPLRI